jgi:hypothetical protein
MAVLGIFGFYDNDDDDALRYLVLYVSTHEYHDGAMRGEEMEKRLLTHGPWLVVSVDDH